MGFHDMLKGLFLTVVKRPFSMTFIIKVYYYY